MADEFRWLTYDEAASLLGITADSVRRMSFKHNWGRRPGNGRLALIAVPEERIRQAAEEITPGNRDVAMPEDRDGAGADSLSTATSDAMPSGTHVDMPDARDAGMGEALAGARALIDHLERRVEAMADDLAGARTDARSARFEADTLRVQAGRSDVLTALVEAERARTAEVRAEMSARVDAERQHAEELRRELESREALGRKLLEAVEAERDRLIGERRRLLDAQSGGLLARLTALIRPAG